MSRPLTPTEECALTHEKTSTGYVQCVNSKISDPYTFGYEVPLTPTPATCIKKMLFIAAAIAIIIVISKRRSY